MSIRGMETKHIEATVAMLKRLGIDPKHRKMDEFKRELNRRIYLGDYHTGCTINPLPFSLGIEGEEWLPELPALMVPTSKTTRLFMTRMDISAKPWAIFMGLGRLGETDREWHYFDDYLMAVSYVYAKREAWGGKVGA